MCADIMYDKDIWMTEPARSPGFLFEPAHPVRVLCNIGRQDLDCDVPFEPLVARAIHFAHPTGAKPRKDFIRTNLCTRDKHGPIITGPTCFQSAELY